MDSNHLLQGRVAAGCGYGGEYLGSAQGGKFLKTAERLWPLQEGTYSMNFLSSCSLYTERLVVN